MELDAVVPLSTSSASTGIIDKTRVNKRKMKMPSKSLKSIFIKKKNKSMLPETSNGSSTTTVIDKVMPDKFITNPFPMQLKTTKSNSKNLYNHIVKSLTKLHMGELSYEWFIFIFGGLSQNYIYDMLNNINSGLIAEHRIICPRLVDIWNWSKGLSPKDVSVVILDCVPYCNVVLAKKQKKTNTGMVVASSLESKPALEHGREHIRMCDGLAFSVSPDYIRTIINDRSESKINTSPIDLLPVALKCVIDKAAPRVYSSGTYSGNLSSWVKQGVLLLNTTFTTVAGHENAHDHIGWEYITDLIIKRISEKSTKHVVFMLWGNELIAKSNLINPCKHILLKGDYPLSTRSAFENQPSTSMSLDINRLMIPTSNYSGWQSTQHFITANLYLKSMNRSPIVWESIGE